MTSYSWSVMETWQPGCGWNDASVSTSPSTWRDTSWVEMKLIILEPTLNAEGVYCYIFFFINGL